MKAFAVNYFLVNCFFFFKRNKNFFKEKCFEIFGFVDARRAKHFIKGQYIINRCEKTEHNLLIVSRYIVRRRSIMDFQANPSENR